MTNRSSDSPVIVGTDLSLDADVAIHTAASWAAREGTSVVIAHVGPDHAISTMQSARETDALIARVEGLAETLGVPAEFLLLSGSPPQELDRLAEERAARLLVVGPSTKSMSERLVLGSTAAHVVRHARCPVLVVRHSAERGCVLAGTDFSEEARPAISAAAHQARLRGVPLHLVHSIFEAPSPLAGFGPLVVSAPVLTNVERDVLRDAAGETLLTLLQSTEVDGEAEVLVGEPGRSLVSAAEADDAGLVVVATHGRTGLRRLVLGSVAEFVVRHAPCSVLVVRSAR